MAGEIITKPLAEVLDTIIDHRGRTPKKLGGDFSGAGVRVLSAKNIKGGRINLSTEMRYVSEEMFDRWMPVKLEIGDVLLTSEAPLGEVAFLLDDADFCLGQRLFALRPNRELVYPRYLFYALRSDTVQHRLHARATGTTAQGIRQSELLQVLFDFPRDIKEQQAIAHILGTLDDKIELNRRLNRTLEEMARAIFKSWFVDFDPVRAKAAGQQPPGLAPHIADLFPDEFEDSELGEIPKGWDWGALSDVAANHRRSVSPEEIVPTTPYIGLGDMPRQSIALDQWGTADGLASSKFRFNSGEILFGKLRPYFHKVGVAPITGICSTDILVIGPKSPVWLGLVLGHVSSPEFVAYTSTVSTGTKMPRVNWKDMARYPIALPPQALAAALTTRVKPLIERMQTSVHESHTLAALRDALLPKLMSRQIRVEAATSLVKEAGL